MTGQSKDLAAFEETILFPGTPGLRRHVRFDVGPDFVRGELADDYHHFAVELRHDGEVIREVIAQPIRHPWSMCAESSAFLVQRLTGTPLREAASFDAQASHCTHQYDLAIAAAAHAFVEGTRLYRIFVSDLIEGQKRGVIYRGNAPLLDWTVEDAIIVAPADFAGRDLKKLRAWLDALPEDQREPAKLLRRTLYISAAREMRLSDSMITQRDGQMTGACYSFQPERMTRSTRTTDYVREFVRETDDPLKGKPRDR